MSDGINRAIICGGGSGGHVFPAIAIANELRRRNEGADVLFIGAKGKIEMEKVPKAGYHIKGLWISGLKRSLTWSNVIFPFKVLSSIWRSRKIIRDFGPEVVIGVGGFASGPAVYAAAQMGKPTLIQEQNSYAGLTNKWLGGRVDRICVAYPEMERFFPAAKIVLTGNPVRSDLARDTERSAAYAHFGLDPARRTILLFGGSLGAATLNRAMRQATTQLASDPEVQWIWQMGSLYESDFKDCRSAQLENVQGVTFIDRMDLAYQVADLVICRAGALTIAELCMLGKPSILVPSPNVAEDHQSANARSLTQREAAHLIADREAGERLVAHALDIIHDKELLEELSRKIRLLAQPEATRKIVDEIERLVHG